MQQVDLETAKKTAIERGPATKVLNKADLFRDKASLKAASLTAPVTQGRAVGDTCAEPKPVTDAFVDSDTTEFRPDTYDDTCMGSYDSDQDIIYEWTVTADACYNVTLDPGDDGLHRFCDRYRVPHRQPVRGLRYELRQWGVRDYWAQSDGWNILHSDFSYYESRTTSRSR